jgi:uncharacterized membrane protein
MAVQKSPSIVRLELFSDGVLAIVVTIMALELRIPEFHESIVSRWNYTFLTPALPKLLSYALGFYFVGSSWVAHLQVTRHLQHTSIRLISMNLLYLFFVSLAPAVTAFLGNHPTSTQAVTLIMLLASLALIVASRLIDACGRLGVAVPRWVWRRNRVCLGLVVLGIIGTQMSVYIGWAMAIVVNSLVWVPGQLAARVFGPSPSAEAAHQHDKSANV